jgi:hypothetical protein
MRLIPTNDRKKIAIIAATKRELSRLQTYKHLTQFKDNLTLKPEKNEGYQCFMCVYTFETIAQAKLFRLAYGLVKGRFKHVARVYPSYRRPPSYYAAHKASRKKKATHRKRKYDRLRKRFRIAPLLKAGNITSIERKARQIARELLIIDLL